MRFDGLNLFKLEILTVIVDEKSFSAAAEKLNLSQPAVSRHVRELEQICGTSLFVRLGRGVEPTDFGLDMYYYALQVLSGAQDLHAKLDQLVKGYRGNVSLGVSPTFSLYVLPQALDKFFINSPDVCVDIEIGNSDLCCAKVLEGSLDFGIFHVSHLLKLPNWLERRDLFKDELVLVVGSSTQDSIPNTISATEFSQLSFLAPGENSESIHTLVVAELTRCGLEIPPIRIRATSLEMTKTLTTRGLGISFLPRMAVAKELELGLLREIKIFGEPSLSIGYTLISRPLRNLSPAAKNLLETIRLIIDNEE